MHAPVSLQQVRPGAQLLQLVSSAVHDAGVSWPDAGDGTVEMPARTSNDSRMEGITRLISASSIGCAPGGAVVAGDRRSVSVVLRTKRRRRSRSRAAGAASRRAGRWRRGSARRVPTARARRDRRSTHRKRRCRPRSARRTPAGAGTAAPS